MKRGKHVGESCMQFRVHILAIWMGDVEDVPVFLEIANECIPQLRSSAVFFTPLS